MYNMQKHEVSYEVEGQQIKLDMEAVRNLIAVGSNITNQEIVIFMEMCKYQRLNPFVKDVYLIKFGKVAQMVTSVNVMTQRLNEYSNMEGWNAGVLVINKLTNEELYKKGTFFNKDTETLVGAWFEASIKGWKTKWENTVSIDEYFKYDNYGKPQGQWGTMTATMIVKCVIAASARRLLPGEFKGVYTSEELGDSLEKAIDITPVPAKEPVKQVEVKPEFVDIFDIGEIVESCKSDIVDVDADSLINYLLNKMNIESLDMLEKNKLSVFKKSLKNLIKLKEEKEKKNTKEESVKDKDDTKDDTEVEVNIVDVLEPVKDGEPIFEEFKPGKIYGFTEFEEFKPDNKSNEV
jgi:phage recombination protein Bet